ncbi:uncharacterized protein [Littorina saxatilis]|uniref:DNTTIP1 dimerisation domain-containing protein n=1 Tax=Littorina saxatilis TaxID=31220 RepID=A0AAN9AJE0_9CAEN
MDHNQRSTKNRSHDLPKQARKPEGSQPKSRQGLSGNQSSVVTAAVSAGQDIQFLNAEFLRHHQYGGVPAMLKGGPGANTIPAHVKIQRGADVYHAPLPGQVMMLKADKESMPGPLGDPPPVALPTTKSSSLSRDISPSRITAQVNQVMSETTGQPLLLSALTGRLPPQMMMAGTKPDHLQDPKRVQDVSNQRGSPYHTVEQRHSPVQVDSFRAAMEGREAKRPFENLMRAAALLQAQELQGSLSPSRQQFGVQQLSPGNHQHTDNRNRTPSPKPVSAARSPQGHTHSGQRRSPVGQRSSPAPAQGSRSSPAPAHSQGLLTAMPVPMTMVQIPHMGLVQQHLLSGTIANPHITPSAHTTPGQHTTIPFAPSVPSAASSNVRLSAIPIDMSGMPSPQKPKSSKNSHVSIGTGTDLKHYASHGAQTSKGSGTGESVKVKQEEAKLGHAFQPHRKEWSAQVQGRGLGTQGLGVAVSQSIASGGIEKRGVSPVMSAVSVGGGLSYPSAISSTRTFTSAAPSAVNIRRSQGSTVPERQRYSPTPTSAHGGKPISVPSSHSHVHAHIHQHSALPRHHVPVTTVNIVPSTINHVSTAPISQPITSMSRLPTPSTHIQPTALRVKQEPRATTVSSTVTASAVSYQPHHHQYHRQSPPAQTITSQTTECGPVVKDFIPVVQSPEPPPYHPQQHPIPSHKNPFTFPTTGIKIHDLLGDGPSYTLTRQVREAKELERAEAKAFEKSQGQFSVGSKSFSDVTGQKQTFRFFDSMDQKDEMPRLTLEGFYPPLKSEAKHGAFNHVGSFPRTDGKEQLMQPYNRRLQNLNNFPSMAQAYRSAYRSHSVALQRAKAGSITSAAKSLDLLRVNIQKNINKELHEIIQKYVDKFFRPAADNIRLNNGTNSVSEEHINAVCRQIFEEAKRMYATETRRSVTPIGDFPDNVSETGSLNGRRVSPIPSSKRTKASDSDSEKGSENGIPKKVPRRKGRPPLNSSGRTTPVKPPPKEGNVKREGPKWDPERIKSESLFVMGARANKALGLGNTRGRLYIRHPDVFKYSGDQEDKIWLHEQKLMPATGGKAYMLLVEDIIDLSKTDEYRDSPTLLMHECRGFEVPEWMIIKIKAQMQSQRSDLMKESRSRSRSPVSDRPEPPKTLPFSIFSDTASNNDMDSIGNKNSLQPSPADTEEMEFLSGMENEDTQPSDVSHFNVTGGFDDTLSRSPCPIDTEEDDLPITTPFS